MNCYCKFKFFYDRMFGVMLNLQFATVLQLMRAWIHVGLANLLLEFLTLFVKRIVCLLMRALLLRALE